MVESNASTRTVIKGVKAFDKDLKCRGFQYEIGKTFTHDGEVSACESGYHFCENPLDCFSYYPPAESRYAIVDGAGEIDRSYTDSKVACSKLTVFEEIDLKGLVGLSVERVKAQVDWKNAKESNTDDRSVATNTGDRSAATNTGDRSAATNTGYYSAATNTGDRSAATNTGDRSAATNTGNRSAATNTGDRSAATNTGDYSAATNTGNRSAATNTGEYSVAANTGYRSAATNTGNYSVSTNTGHYSVATNTGYRSAATNTGNRSAATNTGDRSAASVEGEHSVAMVTGIKGKAKGALGCALCLVERNDNWEIIAAKAVVVDGETIKPGIFYMLVDGELAEVPDGH